MADNVSKITPCKTCDGRGKVDSRNGKSWRRFSGMHPDDPDQALIYAGTLFPKPCPDCKGTGLVEETSSEPKPANDNPAAS